MSDLHHLRQELRRLESRLEQVHRSWTVDDQEALLGFYVRVLPELFEAERCSIFFTDTARGNVWLKIGTGLEPRQIEAPLEGSAVGRAVSTGACIIENNLERHPGFHTQMDVRTGFVTRNLICAPVRCRTSTVVTAVVELLNKRIEPGFTLEDRERLQEVAFHLSIVIDNISIQAEMLAVSTQINGMLRGIDPALLAGGNLVAASQAMQEVLAFARSVAQTPVNVFIGGENGTGKEVISRLIHDSSDARDKPFVAVNCASIPENLVEGEFFGHEKGAFTGAVSARKGRFEEADTGTLFLDEIADLPLAIQPKFLRVLQDGEVTRLGSNKVTRLQFRVISATNKDIRQEVAAGRFREDLYYRLFSVEVHIPPLRERREDILPLAESFLRETCRRFQKRVGGFSPAVIHLFENYGWPGNVRQLRREVERLVTLTPEGGALMPASCSPELRRDLGEPPPRRDGKTEPSALMPVVLTPASADGVAGPVSPGLPNTLTAVLLSEEASLKVQVQTVERYCIDAALRASGGNRQEAARRLGITRQWLHRKIGQYGL
ncbi:MAG: sigma-54-dependent Fis family transcriptional regulator [Magnetococcales bacterium]|nr:sigma-54-dependent Fis family transcriptional regulator [Magnetococcales bacterium]